MDDCHSSTISGPVLSWILFSILSLSLVARAQNVGDFMIAVLPDTQNYSQYYPQIFDAQTQWIANNAAALNLQLVIGVGDIVNIGTDPTQWANATHSVGILDQAGVPYAFAIGNHDYDTLPPTSRSATNFNKYFGPARYANASYYGASNFPPGSNENFYETFNWPGQQIPNPGFGICTTQRGPSLGEIHSR
jgi:calcineurin-like phosphoesterase family protein